MQFFLHSYGDYRCPPEWRVTEDRPFYNRLYYVCGGSAQYRSAAEQFKLEPGRLYLFPQSVAYSVTQDPSDLFHTVYFHVTSIPATSVPVDCTPQTPGDRDLLRIICENVKAYDREVLQHLVGALLLRTAAPQIPALSDRAIDGTIAYINDHCGDPDESLTSRRLAEIACYEESYFIRKFKRAAGVSPKQYVLNLKLKRAAVLVGTMPLREVCERAGFPDCRNFRKQFRTRYGVTPSEFAEIKNTQI